MVKNMKNKKDKLVIELFIKEEMRVGEVIKKLETIIVTILNMSLIISGWITVYLVEKIKTPLLIFLNMISIAIFFYTIGFIIEIRCLGGYKKFLEEKINKITGKNILQWESYFSSKQPEVNFADCFELYSFHYYISFL